MSALQRVLTEQRMAREASEEVQPVTVPVVQPQQTQIQQPAPAPQPEETVRQRADQTEKVDLERGGLTNAGEFIANAADYLSGGGITSDGLNAIAAGLNAVSGGNLQGLDDSVKSYGELQEIESQITSDARDRLVDGEGQVGDRALVASAAISDAATDLPAMPVALAARLANQDASDFSEPPAEVKGSAFGETAYQITQIVAPSLLGLGGSTLVARAAVEATVETIPVRGADDLILGREAAIKVGEAAQALGYDGKQVTQDLIEGKTVEAQITNAVAGWLQSFGINIGAELLFGRIGRLLGHKQTDEVIEQVGRITGKSADEVAASLDNVSLPNKGRDYDISEAIEIDTGVPLPNEGNEFINSDAFLTTALRRSDAPFLENSVDATQPSYFTNIQRFTDEKSYQQALEEAVKELERLPSASKELANIQRSAKSWIDEFVDTTTGRLDVDRALASYPYDDVVTESTGKGAGLFASRGEDAFLREGAITTPAGSIVSTIVGQEMSERLFRQANEIMSVEGRRQDWTAAVERYLEMQQKTQLFMVPLRRFQRRFHLMGESLQKSSAEKVRANAPVKDAKKTKVDRGETSPSRDFELIRKTPDDEGRTIKELLDAYKAGDADAGNTLKTYFAVLSNSNPKTTIAMMDNLQDVLLRELKLGNRDASRKMLYAGYLTRISPIQASVFSNLFNLLKEPLGIAMSRGEGNQLYAVGELLGGLNVMSDAFRVAKKAFDKGGSINGATGTKLDIRIKEAAAEQARLERLWQGAQRELNAKGANNFERAIRWLDYNYQMFAARPFNGLAGRMFIGADEFSNVLYGGMVAGGRAMREAGSKNFIGTVKDFKNISSKHLNEVFADGVKNGVITDAGVSQGMSRLTFSRPIPRDGNHIDKFFASVSDSAQDSKVFTWISPFTRASYNLMEQGGIMMASSIPIPSRRVKEWMLGTIIPRYRKTLNGDFGEIAKLQLKGDIAFANYTSMMVGIMAFAGGITGRNPDEGMPEQSFIFPANNSKGYVAVPYGRLEPFATYFSVVADATKAFRDNVMTEQDFIAFGGQVAAATGLATVDKSFLMGLNSFTELFDLRNLGPGQVVTGSKTVGGIGTATIGGAYAGALRMISDWTNPYETLSKDDPSRDFVRTLWASFAARHLGGHTNPVRYDPLTGEKELKVGGLQGKERWLGALKGMLNETFIPGKVKSGDNRDIYDTLEIIGYDANRFYSGVRTAEGIPLSLEQQSILLQDLHDYGGLARRLRAEFKLPKVDKLIKDLRRSKNDTSEEGKFRTERLEGELQAVVSRVYAEAKGRAVSVGRLSKDDGYLTSRIAKNNSRRPQQAAEEAAMEKKANPDIQRILNFTPK